MKFTYFKKEKYIKSKALLIIKKQRSLRDAAAA
jgi:hypothetical protein